ncbi:hypothetical protein HAZT_HAZT003111 [Hyalella azteca]|uniref:DNA repair and recombination protein RAD54-like n=1 Tax=Hyalella azteca TaxID=294128 RepID=A0A6A0H028_HYAAZ|nr:hypothetical protein HAZT_HAZT003111 [Hyalella azteca]
MSDIGDQQVLQTTVVSHTQDSSHLTTPADDENAEICALGVTILDQSTVEKKVEQKHRITDPKRYAAAEQEAAKGFASIDELNGRLEKIKEELSSMSHTSVELRALPMEDELVTDDDDASEYLPSDSSRSSDEYDAEESIHCEGSVIKKTAKKLISARGKIRPKLEMTRRERNKLLKEKKRAVDDSNFDSYEKRIKKWKKTQVVDCNNVSGSLDYEVLGRSMRVPSIIWSRLYKYQRTGVQWLWQLHSQGCGGILGDEMGLGKTVQVIAFLAGLRCGRDTNHAPVLIVCPATLLHQWVSHFHAWWPPFRVGVLHQSGGYAGSSKVLMHNIVKDKGVLITSYTGVRLHLDSLLKHNWQYVILDEGHKIRNPDAQVTVAVKSFNTPHRLILSGSPIQNSLKELWSLFDFVFPSKLGTLQVFLQQFAVPITHGGFANASRVEVETGYQCAVMLRDTISPYLLRRMKSDVKAHLELPDKSEQVLFCALTKEQRQLYQEYLAGDQLSRIMSGKMKVFVGLTNLRKLCNHPDLFTGGIKLCAGETEEDIPRYNTYGWWERSGKMQVVQGVLKVWHQQKHRVLLFSQSSQMLAILEKFVAQQNYTYLKMSGSTAVGARQGLVKQFNKDANIFVFLLTTRVGGLGVNLVGADRVLIYDPDWNPSTDTQARERAWRIGQLKNVTIYRLLTAGTIEEKIYHRQIFKQFLTNRVLKDPKQQRFFKTNDLFELFSLNEGEEEKTESSALFAGLNSDVIPSKVARKARKDESRHVKRSVDGAKKRARPQSMSSREKDKAEPKDELRKKRIKREEVCSKKELSSKSLLQQNDAENLSTIASIKDENCNEYDVEKSNLAKKSNVNIGNETGCSIENPEDGISIGTKSYLSLSPSTPIGQREISSPVLKRALSGEEPNPCVAATGNLDGVSSSTLLQSDGVEKAELEITEETSMKDNKISASEAFSGLSSDGFELKLNNCKSAAESEEQTCPSSNEKILVPPMPPGSHSEVLESIESEKPLSPVQHARDATLDSPAVEDKDAEIKREKMRMLARMLSKKIGSKSSASNETSSSSRTKHESMSGVEKAHSGKIKTDHRRGLGNNCRRGRKFEGERISYLVKKRKAKGLEDEKAEDSKAQDDYVLSKLFKRSGVHTALSHDAIVNSSDPDYLLLQSEADRVAKEAMKALRASRSRCPTLQPPKPNPIRFGIGSSDMSEIPRFNDDKPRAEKDTVEDTFTLGGCSFDSEGSGMMSSSQLLQRIRERQTRLRGTNDDERENEEVSGSSVAVELDATTSANLDLLSDIRNFVAFQASTDGRASTNEIIDKFRARLPKEKTHIFKALLKEICDFRKDNGQGFWYIKPEFQ